jgi:hypothetical protein
VSFVSEGETYFSQVFTGDETWVHHFEPERKKKKAVRGMAPILICLEEKNSKSFHQWARSLSLSSGTMKEQFLRMQC